MGGASKVPGVRPRARIDAIVLTVEWLAATQAGGKWKTQRSAAERCRGAQQTQADTHSGADEEVGSTDLQRLFRLIA